MCITHINVHTCGHTSYVDTVVCRARLQALEITTYMDRPDSEKQADPVEVEVDEDVLLTTLAEWRRECAQVSGERGRRRNYKCGECLEEMLKRTGLAEAEEGFESDLVERMGRTGV